VAVPSPVRFAADKVQWHTDKLRWRRTAVAQPRTDGGESYWAALQPYQRHGQVAMMLARSETDGPPCDKAHDLGAVIDLGRHRRDYVSEVQGALYRYRRLLVRPRRGGLRGGAPSSSMSGSSSPAERRSLTSSRASRRRFSSECSTASVPASNRHQCLISNQTIMIGTATYGDVLIISRSQTGIATLP
jgi:hypothetical protein